MRNGKSQSQSETEEAARQRVESGGGTVEDIPYLLAQLRDSDEKLEAVGRLCPEHPQTKWVGRPCKDDEWWIEELDRILKGGE